jgi:hypothetical protein
MWRAKFRPSISFKNLATFAFLLDLELQRSGKNKSCLVIATFSGEISRFEILVMVFLLH